MFAARALFMTTPSGVALPVAFDAVATGQSGAFFSSINFSHTATAGAYVIVDVVTDRTSTVSNVQYGGVAMALLGTSNHNNSASNGTLRRYGLAGVAGGSQTVTGSATGSAWARTTAVSYVNVGSVGATTSVFGSGNSLSQGPITCPAGGRVVQSFSQGNGGAVLTSVSGGTNRYNTYANFTGLTISDSDTTGTFAGTASGSPAWAGLATVLTAS